MVRLIIALMLLVLMIFLTSFLACDSGGGGEEGRSGSPGDDDTDSLPDDDDNDNDDATPDDDDDDDDDDNDDNDDTTPDDDDDDDNDDDNDDDTTNCVAPYQDMDIFTDTVICPREDPYNYSLDEGQPIFIITGNNLILSGYGATVSDTGDGYGIIFLDPEAHDVKIRGLTLKGFKTGIFSYAGASDIVIRDVTIEDSVNMHIMFDSNDDRVGNHRITIRGVTAINSHNTGIGCADCYDSVMKDITSTNNLVGVIESNLILFGGSGNLIENNTIYTRNSSGCNAIWLTGSDDNIVQGNSLDLGYKDGSHMHSSSDNIYRNNTFHVSNSWQYTIWLGESTDDTDADLAGLPETLREKAEKYKGVPSSGNSFYGNDFYTGILMDDEGVNSIFCVDNVGNDYFDTATYSGPDTNEGTCP